jgi:hypothetical protein
LKSPVAHCTEAKDDGPVVVFGFQRIWPPLVPLPLPLPLLVPVAEAWVAMAIAPAVSASAARPAPPYVSLL